MIATAQQLGSGLHKGISAQVYHADPAPKPSLSSSIAKVLINESPLHARHEHPRLNRHYEPKQSDKFDLGTAAHAYLMQGEDICVVIDAEDYRKNDTKKQRDAARKKCKTPLLIEQWERVIDMTEAANRQLDDWNGDDGPRPLSNFEPEQVGIWKERGVYCRSMLDALHNDNLYLDDYKTTEASAKPSDWARTMINISGDMQFGFHSRCVKKLTGVMPRFRFIVQEVKPPYALSVVSLPPEWSEIAAKKAEYAISMWANCMHSGKWPGYPNRTCYLDAPPWEIAKWEHMFMEATA